MERQATIDPALVDRSVDQRVVLRGVSWSEYETLLAIRGDEAGVRMAYLEGTLELMTPSRDHETLKKTFTPEGMILGYNTMFFEWDKASPLQREFVKWHKDKFNEWANYESDHAYFTVVAYKAAVEKAAKAAGGKWPSQDQIIHALEGIEAESLQGKRSYRQDHIMEASFFQGLTTHKNAYDFVTINPVEVMTAQQVQKPSGMGLYDWINSWKV